MSPGPYNDKPRAPKMGDLSPSRLADHSSRLDTLECVVQRIEKKVDTILSLLDATHRGKR
jgi:hypothetical protein